MVNHNNDLTDSLGQNPALTKLRMQEMIHGQH